MNKRWQLLPNNEIEAKQLATSLNINMDIAKILAKKKLSVEEARDFLYPEQTKFHDPFLLKGMDKATERLVAAIKNKEKVCVYGDYDVDGVTSTSLLMQVFANLGMNVSYFLPDRHKEGYGLNMDCLKNLVKEYDLIITVDCGITAIPEVAFTQEHIDIIITDHHLPLETLPEAYAIINPHQPECIYPNKYLCGVGVAFKICQGLYKKLNLSEEELLPYLDIVALGTVADLVPLLDENRKIVKQGLNHINNLGIQKLLEVANYQDKTINTGHIGFGVAPRLNAAGRLTHAKSAVEVLLANNIEDAEVKANYLDKENKTRQAIVEDIVLEATEMVEINQLYKNKVIVVAKKDWNEGVIGIAASRLQEKYYRPIVIIALREDMGKASCRSINGFHMKEALDYCANDLIIYGGHSKAAGFSIALDKLDDFREHIYEYGDKVLKEDDLIPLLPVENVINVKDLNIDFVEQLSLLEPFGMGNPKPSFVCENLYVKQAKRIGGDGTHLKVDFQVMGRYYTGLGWNMADYVDTISNKNLDILFQPEINNWNGRVSVQFKLQDLRINQNGNNYLAQYPNYETIGQLYLTIKSCSKAFGNIMTVEQISSSFNNKVEFNTALKILEELGLIKIEGNKVELLALPKGKLNINDSPTYKKRFAIEFI